jgi:CelD/BcsL family acetyltransferase involved in cellulose biosynthesis
MNVERIDVNGCREERSALAESLGNVFATPEFHETWWRHFGVGREPLVHAVRDGERLAGLLPLYVWRRAPMAVARFIGHGGGDELGPIALDEDRPAVAEVLPEIAPSLTVAEHVRPEWTQALGGTVLLAEGSPVLRVASFDGWDDYLGTRSSNFRQILRNRPRRLEKAHRVEIRLADEETLEADLDTLFRLHRSRWQRRTTFGSREPFHRDFARVALAAGWARLVVLDVDGEAAAAWYGFRFGGSDSYYQSGRDARFERESVGLVLLTHTIRSAFDAGRHEYRFLRGDEPYKFRFTDDDARVETIAVARGAAARTAVAAVRAARVTQGSSRRLRRSLQRARRGAASPVAE